MPERSVCPSRATIDHPDTASITVMSPLGDAPAAIPFAPFYPPTCRSSASRPRQCTLTVGRGGARPTPRTAPPRHVSPMETERPCADTAGVSVHDNPTSPADRLVTGDNRIWPPLVSAADRRRLMAQSRTEESQRQVVRRDWSRSAARPVHQSSVSVGSASGASGNSLPITGPAEHQGGSVLAVGRRNVIPDPARRRNPAGGGRRSRARDRPIFRGYGAESAPRLHTAVGSMPTIGPCAWTATVALVIAPREIAAIAARRLNRSGERQVHRRTEAFDNCGVAARRVPPDALSLPNKSSIIGSCHERSSIRSGPPIRAGASPAERVAGHHRAPGARPTQPLRRGCAALTGAKPAGTTDTPNSAPAAQLAHVLRGAPALSDTAPARHRHRRRPPGHTVLTYPTPLACAARRDISAELRWTTRSRPAAPVGSTAGPCPHNMRVARDQ
jgi:hypothetical protein